VERGRRFVIVAAIVAILFSIVTAQPGPVCADNGETVVEKILDETEGDDRILVSAVALPALFFVRQRPLTQEIYPHERQLIHSLFKPPRS